MISLILLAGQAPGADAPAPVKSNDVLVYAEANESSLLIETVREGDALSPMGEMTGGGGEKWFMVKTPSGNIGWIKAGDYTQVRKVDEHFRSLPKDVGTISPPIGNVPNTGGKAPLSRAVSVPVKMRHNQVVVPVTFIHGFSSVSGNLVMDTGASQTYISKRMARELRLLSIANSYSRGVGGTVPIEIAIVDGMKVGTIGVKNMPVCIVDFSTDPNYEGLLGFDFLGHFQISVDPKKQVMILRPRQND